MTDRVFIPAGQRNGRTFDNEGDFIAALDAGKTVFTQRNGVYFEVTKTDAGILYSALAATPEGV